MAELCMRGDWAFVIYSLKFGLINEIKSNFFEVRYELISCKVTHFLVLHLCLEPSSCKRPIHESKGLLSWEQRRNLVSVDPDESFCLENRHVHF